jgi:hypothetical protein
MLRKGPEKAKGRKQKAKGKSMARFAPPLLVMTFAFCFLPFAF